MSVSEAGGHVFDQSEEKDRYIPRTVVNRLSGAKLPSRRMNSWSRISAYEKLMPLCRC